MNDKAVCRTAPATPGLLNTGDFFSGWLLLLSYEFLWLFHNFMSLCWLFCDGRFMTLSLLFHDFLLTFFWTSHTFLITLLLLLFMTFSWLYHKFLMIYSKLSHYFLKNFSWFSHDFFLDYLMTFSLLLYDFLITSSWLPHDFILTDWVTVWLTD